MPHNRTAAHHLLTLAALELDRDRLRLENELLRAELQRHSCGALQIREVERRIQAASPGLHGERHLAVALSPQAST